MPLSKFSLAASLAMTHKVEMKPKKTRGNQRSHRKSVAFPQHNTTNKGGGRNIQVFMEIILKMRQLSKECKDHGGKPLILKIACYENC